MVADLRFALRALGRTPSVTAVTLLTLALGIGATTAIFSVVDAVLLRPLPYPHPERVVRIVENVPAEESFSGTAVRRSAMSQDDFRWWRTHSHTLSQLAMIEPQPSTLRTAQGTARLAGARVSPALFPILGVAPLLGRGLSDDDERPDADVVALGESAWRRYFRADPHVIGQTMSLDGQPYTIVGVMPATFGSDAFWTPLFVPPAQPGRIFYAEVVARLRDGISLAAANAEADVLGQQLRGVSAAPGAPPRFEVVRELDERVAPVVPALRALIVAVGVVLLIVCTNVANLLLVRGIRRQNEFSIRRSLGATRARIARQVLAESFVLAAFAGLAGVALAYGGVELLKSLASVSLPDRFSSGPAILPRLDEIAVDPVVLAFVAGLSMVTGVAFGIGPAVRLSRIGEIGLMSGAQSTPSARNTRAGYGFATAQIGCAMTLLVGAGLLLTSFLKLAAVDPGFDARNVLSFDLVIPEDYTAERKLQVAEDVTARLQNHTGVVSAGFTDAPPLSPFVFVSSAGYVPPGHTETEIRDEQNRLPVPQRTQTRNVSAGYLRALGARLESGRWFDERQSGRAGMAALVSGPYARHFFGAKDPVGSVLDSPFGPVTIDGVVDDIHMEGLDAQPERIVFLEPRQDLKAQRALQRKALGGRAPPRAADRMFLTFGAGAAAFAVRTSGDPLTLVPYLRTVVEEIDPALAVDHAMPMEQVLSGLMARPRFYAVLISLFGAVAAFIALIGIYGVLAYVVGRRTNEIGIRIALGAGRGAILWLILRHGAWMVAIGVGIGLAGAAGLSRYLGGMLFGVTSLDTGTYASMTALFAIVALFAAYVPARRATAIDPLAALRYE